MSKLILTSFGYTNTVALENYEKNLLPQKSEKVFIFTD